MLTIVDDPHGTDGVLDGRPFSFIERHLPEPDFKGQAFEQQRKLYEYLANRPKDSRVHVFPLNGAPASTFLQQFMKPRYTRPPKKKSKRRTRR